MDLRIEKLISGAYGLAHDDEGRAILVKSALEGEIVRCKSISRRANVLVSEDYEIIKPSEMRIAPSCPHYGKCGGCDFLCVSESTSSLLKTMMVKENLNRITKIDDTSFFLPPSYSSFSSFRSRCRLHVDLRTKEIGFLQRGSNSLHPLSDCPALTGRINDLLKSRDEILKEAQRRRLLYGINKKTGYVEVPVQDGDDGFSLNDRIITAGGYSINANCFFQSNLALLPEMLSFVKENAVGSVIMDLYSGVGTFSRLFEGEGKTVYAVEKNPQCLSLSKKNAPTAHSFTSDALLFSRKVRERVDTLIVDPPRVGLENAIIPILLSWNAERIIYVSCDSTTAARDLSFFNGYRISRAKVFDFYPGSFHEECVFILSKI